MELLFLEMLETVGRAGLGETGCYSGHAKTDSVWMSKWRYGLGTWRDESEKLSGLETDCSGFP